MTNYLIELDNISKTFGRRLIFKNISSKFNSPDIIGVAGKNGAGKSTFVKILANLISPTKGKIKHFINNKLIEPEKVYNYTGFVAPYLVLYDEFTALENLFYCCKIRGINYEIEYAKELLKNVNLFERRNDYVKTYSSGMKQRLKYAFALIHNPNLIILDEPTSNLDNAGKDLVYNFISSLGKEKLIVLASNEQTELKYCSKIIEPEKYKE
ncbi:MAG TPA: ABC transporter ATP-binding protein [Melioribacteraceae bacterium]|nr:ABC transporter ATP-binding protein [Melioribacteraceae bacterium]